MNQQLYLLVPDHPHIVLYCYNITLFFVDESFTSYHPEAHLPLSVLRGRPLHLEVRLQGPPELDLVLLVHSCLAYTQAPYPSWMPIYSRYVSNQDQD